MLKIAGGGRVVCLSSPTSAARPTGEQLVVEVREGGVLDDEEHVEVVRRFELLLDPLAGLALEFVDLARLPATSGGARGRWSAQEGSTPGSNVGAR